MDFAFKYEIWELLRPEEIPETHKLWAIQLTGNAWLIMDKDLSYPISTNCFRIGTVLEV